MEEKFETKRVVVWRAVLDGECYQIGLSEEEVWYELKENNSNYESKDHARWTVTSKEEVARLVSGIVHVAEYNDGDDVVHIIWDCPYCGDQHDTDLEDLESTVCPELWWCEMGNDDEIALVSWDKRKVGFRLKIED